MKQNKIFLAFIDLEKAFDKVPREKVWESLNKRGVNEKTIRIIQNIYKNNINFVIRNNMKSDAFTTKESLRQGGGLSPTLFILFMDEIIKKCALEIKKLNVGYRNLQRIDISEGAFADDVVIMAGTKKDLEHNLNIWNLVLEENGMKMNKKKMRVMMIGSEQENVNIKAGNENIQQVDVFQYLGVEVENNGKQDAEINRRISKTIKLYIQ
uniref:Retrovirus-related Pol polyprotein n=1 Tax=Anoplophora glabripennis TaxID=217634 RepID=V5GWZ6_ANOGL